MLHVRGADGAEEPLYLAVARRVAEEWNTRGNCGLVVGATYPEELHMVREAVGDLPILVPGIGAQGGDLEASVRAGMDSRGAGLLISASRSILYASSGEDFAEAARGEAERLRDAIEGVRSGSRRGRDYHEDTKVTKGSARATDSVSMPVLLRRHWSGWQRG